MVEEQDLKQAEYELKFIPEIELSTSFKLSDKQFHNSVSFSIGEFGGESDYIVLKANTGQHVDLGSYENVEKKLEIVEGRRTLKAIISDEALEGLKLGETGDYLDSNSIRGDLVEILEEKNGILSRIWIGWVGSIGANEGVFVDDLVWESEPKVLDDVVFSSFVNFGSFNSYWRCNQTLCNVFYIEIMFGRFYVGQLFNISKDNDKPSLNGANDASFCPQKLVGWNFNRTGYLLSKCPGEEENSHLYSFYYMEDAIQLVEVPLPEALVDYKGSIDIEFSWILSLFAPDTTDTDVQGKIYQFQKKGKKEYFIELDLAQFGIKNILQARAYDKYLILTAMGIDPDHES